MSDQPVIKIATDKDISPETREMLEGTPEDDVLTDGAASAQPNSSLRIPVPSIPVSDTKDD
jgi:hypothetical protein